MKVKKKAAKIKMTDDARVEAPLVGRRKMMSDHVKAGAPKSAAAKSGLVGRRAFVEAHRHAGGAK